MLQIDKSCNGCSIFQVFLPYRYIFYVLNCFCLCMKGYISDVSVTINFVIDMYTWTSKIHEWNQCRVRSFVIEIILWSILLMLKRTNRTFSRNRLDLCLWSLVFYINFKTHMDIPTGYLDMIAPAPLRYQKIYSR